MPRLPFCKLKYLLMLLLRLGLIECSKKMYATVFTGGVISYKMFNLTNEARELHPLVTDQLLTCVESIYELG